MNLKEWMNVVENKQLNEYTAPPGTVVVKPPVGSTGVAPTLLKGKTPAVTDIIKQLADKGELTSVQGPTQTPTTTTQSKPAGATGQPPAGQQAMAEEEIQEVAPPGMEDVVLALKKKFPGQEGRAYAIAWSQYNKKHPKSKADESVMENRQTVREGMEYSTMNEALKQILDAHPHEHKMCQEGWGMDESLYEALCDHYFREGRIPRKVWHGPLDELRSCVEECYARDTGMLLGEDDDMMDEEPMMSEEPMMDDPMMDDPMMDDPMMEDDLEEGWREKAAAAATAAGLAFGGHQLSQEPIKNEPTVKVIQMELKREMDPLKRDELTRDLERTKNSLEIGRGVPSDILKKYQFRMRDGGAEMREDSKLERTLRHSTKMDETMKESKFSKIKSNKEIAEATKETGRGRIHTAEPGGYGRKFDTDEEGEEKGQHEPKKAEVKRGRGRPKKSGGDADTKDKYSGAKDLQSWIVGNLPKGKLPGKPGKKHKLSDKPPTKKKSVKEDAQMSQWDQQLRTLLSEGYTVTTSMNQEGGHDSVSISATDADAQKLLALIRNTTMGAGAAMAAPAAKPALAAEPAVSGTMTGPMTAPRPEGPKIVPLSTMPGADLGRGGASCDDSAADNGDGVLAMIRKMTGQPGADVQIDEEDVEEGNKFTGELAKERAAMAAGKPGGDGKFKVGKKEFTVTKEEDDGESAAEDLGAEMANSMEAKREGENSFNEGKETCSECGAMYEGEDHQCDMEESSHEHQELNEWANSPVGRSEDEAFEADIDFMTKVISGGLNGRKSSGQTTVPVVASQLNRQISEGREINIAHEMRKLAGIK